MATVKVLVIGGGASGGSIQYPTGGYGSGGGAGGYQYDAAHAVLFQTYNITVGAGGGSNHSNCYGSNGNNSIFDTITAYGGGAGGGMDSGGIDHNGLNGGCGGGGMGQNYGGTGSQGGKGGYGVFDGYLYEAGGGGAGADGNAWNGGTGIANLISGASVYYAGGGASGGSGSGGNGGGGGYIGGVPQPGTDGLGGGGASACQQNIINSQWPGKGGDGIVIISFKTDGSDGIVSGGTSATGSYTKTTSGGYDIYTFTGNGTFTPGVTQTYNLSADYGTVALTGENVGFTIGTLYQLACGVGSLILTGTTITLNLLRKWFRTIKDATSWTDETKH